MSLRGGKWGCIRKSGEAHRKKTMVHEMEAGIIGIVGGVLGRDPDHMSYSLNSFKAVIRGII